MIVLGVVSLLFGCLLLSAAREGFLHHEPVAGFICGASGTLLILGALKAFGA